MKTNVLTIAIPTYNRVHFLKQTLDILLPQLVEGVEIAVYDNCSPDETPEYIKGLGGVVKHVRHSENIGSERNFLACLTQSETEYVWLLGDDDLPASNVIAQILGGIQEFAGAPLFYLRAQPMDKQLSTYTTAPVKSEWEKMNADQFLNSINFWFTFMSSIVVNRKCLDFDFLDKQKDNHLVSGAIVLSVAGRHKGCVVSTKPLIFSRPSDVVGYNGFTVFCRNTHRLLNASKPEWFSRKVIRRTYTENLANVVTTIVASSDIDLKALFTLTRYSYSYKNFYRIVVPILIKRIRRSTREKLYFQEQRDV